MKTMLFMLPMAGVAPPKDKVTPGTWGFVIVASLAVATWFLIRSMLKQLRKVDAGRPADQRDSPADAPERDSAPAPNAAADDVTQP